MNNQPEALRLAEELVSFCVDAPVAQAAAELRRLHEVNQEMVEALKVCINNPYREGTASYNKVIEMSEAALAKATGESNA